MHALYSMHLGSACHRLFLLSDRERLLTLGTHSLHGQEYIFHMTITTESLALDSLGLTQDLVLVLHGEERTSPATPRNQHKQQSTAGAEDNAWPGVMLSGIMMVVTWH